MQKMMAMQLDQVATEQKSKVALADRKQQTHKRMDRWIRLQQFVYGLPDDYSYALCMKENAAGSHESYSLVRVGWMSWYGRGQGVDRQHGLAVALLGTTEALSANSTAALLHKIGRFFGFRNIGFKRKLTSSTRLRRAAEDTLTGELLAG